MIVSPYEHHSNLLPWRELGSDIIYANDGVKTSIDLVDLENKLKKYQNDRRVKIGTFTVSLALIKRIKHLCLNYFNLKGCVKCDWCFNRSGQNHKTFA